MQELYDFLVPVAKAQLNDDEGYADGQLGRHIAVYEGELPNIDDADIIFVGINEARGHNGIGSTSTAANVIRKHVYQLYYWHTDVTIADLGDIKVGEHLKDSYAAIEVVVAALLEKQKTVVLLGGSHDCTLPQYGAYRKLKQLTEVTCVDALIDLNVENRYPDRKFLMELLTGEPNFVSHYNHLAFQSYAVHPRMLETLDKLRFDFHRLGRVSEEIDEMEPVLRNTNMLSIDMNAIKHADAPANRHFPNGLTGMEACSLTRFAGMSSTLSSIGFYGYEPQNDRDELTAIQISQMIWYFIDGKSRSKLEANLAERDHFNEFHTVFAEVDTVFLQSKKTGRWWMQLPGKKFIACSNSDYVQASQNEIPERWLRVQERG